MNQAIWNDNYDDILPSEILYHKAKIMILSKEDWLYILKTRNITLYHNKDLAISLLTTSKLSLDHYIQLMSIFANNTTENEANPQEPGPEQIELIERDVGRTFQKEPFFKILKNQNKIKQILIHYAHYDKEAGYSQGMNFIAAALVYHNVPNEFEMFKQIVAKHRDCYIHGTPGLFLSIAQLKFKVKQHLPKLSEHFSKIGLTDLGICFSTHFLTIFLQGTPFQYQLIVINMYLLLGEKLIYKFLLAMLQISQFRILQITNFEEICKFVQKDMITYFFEELQKSRDSLQLLKLLFSLKLAKKHII